MKIKSIDLAEFKRFKKLTISDLPEFAKLVVLVGPNGCGKSSLFDAIYGNMRKQYASLSPFFGYYDRKAGYLNRASDAFSTVSISFHGNQPNDAISYKKAVYVRSAYRNVPSFSINQLSNMGSVFEENRITRLIDNDQATSQNYNRLVSQALADSFENLPPGTTLGQFRDGALADIREAIKDIFPELILNSLGSPLEGNSTFRFDKGDAKKFNYENLSGGEKAAFDLILDLAVKRRDYDDTVFCIDEPEAHMSLRVQKNLLSVLYRLIPDNCQLWIATHSIGMMREAYQLQKEEPEKVIFLDFDARDFDEPQEIKPTQMNRSMWERIHSVALDDLAGLVFPDELYLCESTPEKSFDADCYNTIFSPERPNAKFISVGSKADVMRVTLILQNAMPDLYIIGIRDRDQMTPAEVSEARSGGIRVLTRTCIEKYLLDDEVLAAFCRKNEFSDDVFNDIKKIRDADENEPKKASQNIRTHIVHINKSLQVGDNQETFLKHSLAPLLTSDMQVYDELKQDIFGEPRNKV